MKRALFLSVHPKYAQSIMEGAKTVELRRVRPAIAAGDSVILYVSSPTKAVAALSVVQDIKRAHPRKLWPEVREKAGITYAEFAEYFTGARLGTAIHIKCVQQFPQPIPLSILVQHWPDFRPPQSYRYLSGEQLSQLMRMEKRLSRKASH